MLDQKAIVQSIYRDMFKDERWIERYANSPDAALDRYGLSASNKEQMKRILALFC
jgi:hypothetical protein